MIDINSNDIEYLRSNLADLLGQTDATEIEVPRFPENTDYMVGWNAVMTYFDEDDTKAARYAILEACPISDARDAVRADDSVNDAAVDGVTRAALQELQDEGLLVQVDGLWCATTAGCLWLRKEQELLGMF